MSLPDDGHIWLILYESTSNPPGFYLDLDVTFIKTLCHKPVGYLKYLAYCILGLTGDVYLNGMQVSDGAEPRGKSLYLFRPDADGSDPLGPHSIDMEAIKVRSPFNGTPTSTRNRFKEDLIERDFHCIFTGFPHAKGTHMIPFVKQDEWIQIIIRSRAPDPLHDDNVEDLTSINDIRNGMSVNPMIHVELGNREYAVLVTPNLYLKTGDVPRAESERPLHPEIAYPDGQRYTLQRLIPINSFAVDDPAPNRDAAFRKVDELPSKLPSKLLLSYTYGAAAVERWGRNWGKILSKEARPDLKRPAIVQLPNVGSSRTLDGCSVTVRREADAGGTDASGSAGSQVIEQYDAMDLVAYFWYNTPAARERREQSEQAFRGNIDSWRSGVT
ncbi:hypothetical protein BC834DRAFT_875637 [Gloeopeniophorella convolvens]|nr:hypothetical protein BC834DRAFT_875637 [Gloeopeniophorella convolvens]